MPTQQDPSLAAAATTRDSVPHDRGASCQICALAALSINDAADDVWYPDSGAMDHITPTAGKLHNMRQYSGPKSVCVGDGARLSIAGIGQMSLATPHILWMCFMFHNFDIISYPSSVFVKITIVPFLLTPLRLL
ncbi:hypothetical protein MLD38_014036 [Melastoma candidum]|uniref:Uncharacterized protein n=1 Tax=Melastoma candidum TaxID=119954 RepID=A0ACB9REL1_9MYRT|nr:hypothetical protein MLD38_014036 [Melastoma candidum]